MVNLGRVSEPFCSKFLQKQRGSLPFVDVLKRRKNNMDPSGKRFDSSGKSPSLVNQLSAMLYVLRHIAMLHYQRVTWDS